MTDYYKVLEVDKTASLEEIKKSYRRLASVHHPDKHHGKETQGEAEARFKQISEAYSVLSDPEKRAEYDQPAQSFRFHTTGDGFNPFEQFFARGFRRSGPAARDNFNRDVRLNLSLQLVDALLGKEEHLEYGVLAGCAVCTAQGATEFETCAECKGAGVISRQQDNFFFQQSCHSCLGNGKRPTRACETCQGKGIINESRSINFQVPPGIRHGAVLRIRGAGGKGVRGDTGDLLLQISIDLPSLDHLGPEEKEQLKNLLQPRS